MKTPVALFPFSAENLAVVQYFNKLQNTYELVKLISPTGFAFSGYDAGFSAAHSNIGIIVEDTLDTTDSSWSVLIVTDINDEIDTLKKLKAMYMKQSLEAGKKVQYYPRCHSPILKEILDLKEQYPMDINIFQSTYDYEKLMADKEKDISSSEITIPIIFVGGLLEQADVLEVTLKLTECLKSTGMNVVTFCKSELAPMLHCNSIMSIITDNSLTEIQKIEYIHTVFKEIEIQNFPDIIIVEAPDAIMRYNVRLSNGYGILTHILAQAISFDYFICCMPFELAQKSFIDMFSRDIRVRLGYAINSVHASNIILDLAESFEKNKISIVHVPMEMVESYITNESENIPVLNMVIATSESIIDTLMK